MGDDGAMPQGRVYTWIPDPTRPLGGSAKAAVVPLPNLVRSGGEVLRLQGSHVVVHNAGAIYVPGRAGGITSTPVGDAFPNEAGDFIFEQGRGGGRMDKVALAEADFRWRYVQASRFGEVNVYFHIDRIATYINDLLGTLGTPPLPVVIASVNAHHAATELDEHGRRDGVHGRRVWLPFQGGHYRLSTRSIEVEELLPVAPAGEIHLGPGWRLLDHGALVEVAGGRYRANASHNPGIIYHEYGHHITRHTADLSANALRLPDRQDNRKTALDEGMCDYWAASMLDTPHIWAFHHRHDANSVHPRSLVSPKTMADYDHDRRADAHGNGTIWAAALWDLRSELTRLDPDLGARRADRLVLACLLGLGRVVGHEPRVTPGRLWRTRSDFAAAAAALLEADRVLETGHRAAIVKALSRRGIGAYG